MLTRTDTHTHRFNAYLLVLRPFSFVLTAANTFHRLYADVGAILACAQNSGGISNKLMHETMGETHAHARTHARIDEPGLRAKYTIFRKAKNEYQCRHPDATCCV